jgi:hypothetical protein
MVKKKITLDALAASLAKMNAEMRKGFARQGATIENLSQQSAGPNPWARMPSKQPYTSLTLGKRSRLIGS